MRTYARSLTAGAALALACLAAPPATQAADPPGAAANPKPPAAVAPAAVAPAEVARWVAELDDDRFAVRETAQQRLAAAGAAALPGVGQTAVEGSLESATRAVALLLEWSQSPDAELSMGALERLAALTNRPAEAALAADRLADVREVAAIRALVELGGRVDYDRQVQSAASPTPSLQVIIGPQWKGGVDGLRHLAAMRRASTLSFHSAELDEEQVVAHLPELAGVQRIEFYGVALSDESTAEIKKRLPNANIEIRSGARLGIVGSHPIQIVGPGGVMGQPGPGALVRDVLANSSAAKAGIQPGDLITHFKGVEIRDFEHLTEEIAKCQPGDSVQLTITRPAPPGQIAPNPQQPGNPPAAQPALPPGVQPAQPVVPPVTSREVTVTFDRWGDDAPTGQPAFTLPADPAANRGNPFGVPRGPVIINDRR